MYFIRRNQTNAQQIDASIAASVVLSLIAAKVYAQDDGVITTNEIAYAVDNIISVDRGGARSVHAGRFCHGRGGFNSAKNAVNIMFKNIIDLCAGVLLFWLIGYSLMYGATEIIPGWLASAASALARRRRKRCPATSIPRLTGSSRLPSPPPPPPSCRVRLPAA